MYLGEPKVNVQATAGNLLTNTLFQQQVKQEQSSVRDDLEHLRYLPVINIRLAYRFDL
jgi:hypothetical protein